MYGYVYGKRYNDVKIALAKHKKSVTYSESSIYQRTVSEWLDYWLYTALKDKLRPSSKASYESKIKNYIRPFLGKIKLYLLERKEINNLVGHLLSQQYSENTIKTTISILKSSLNYAVQNDYLLKNPCSNISVSSGNLQKAKALSLHQQKSLETAAFAEYGCSATLLSLSTGMRIGEICGLRWADIDFVQNTISVERTLQRVPSMSQSYKTEIIIGVPKTKSSIRRIPLPPKLKDYLLEKQTMQLSEYVVATKPGFIEPRAITYRFKKIVKASGITPINFHVLRHTFATRCIENGIDIAAVSKLLGHTSTKMTLDMYTDSLWENRKQAMSIIDTVVFK